MKQGLLLFMLLVVTTSAACVPLAQPEGWAGPGLGEDGLFLAAKGGQLVAVSAVDGTERWRFAPEGSDRKLGPVYAAPLVVEGTGPDASGGLVYVGTYTGHVYAIEAGTGALRWQFPGPANPGAAFVAPPVLSGGKLYVTDANGNLFTCDAATGSPCVPLPFKADDGIWGGLTLHPSQRIVYVPSLDRHLYAVDLDTGEKRWSFKAEGALVGRPAIAGGVVFVGGLDRVLYAVDASSGELIWQSDPFAGWLWAAPLATAQRVYAADLKGEVRAFGLRRGEIIWETRLDSDLRDGERAGEVVATPRLADNLLLVATSPGRVYGLDPASGATVWARPFIAANGSPLRGELAVGGDLAYVYGPKGTLYALDLATGRPRWQRDIPAVQ
ncbi:MAG: PQQ-like beta-propeller repeat protein [Chloroflexi bacterium]|nr:PQQ-like beta-propeller repeat protein [Chloroflexota bacterium]